MRAIVNRFHFYTYSGSMFFQEFFNKRNEIDKRDPDLAAFYQERINMVWNWEDVHFQIGRQGITNYYGEDDTGKRRAQTKKFIEQLKEIGGFEMINFLRKCLEHIDNNKAIIDYRNVLDYSENDDILEEVNRIGNDLDQKFKYSIPFVETQKLLENFVRDNSDEFCVDENGNIHESTFTGKLQYTNVYHGTIEHEYNFLNSKPHGECMDFYQDGKPKALLLFKNGKIMKALRRWQRNGEELKGELHVPSSENFNN